MKRNHTIREEDLCRFSRHLHDLEYAPGSIEKYRPFNTGWPAEL